MAVPPLRLKGQPQHKMLPPLSQMAPNTVNLGPVPSRTVIDGTCSMYFDKCGLPSHRPLLLNLTIVTLHLRPPMLATTVSYLDPVWAGVLGSLVTRLGPVFSGVCETAPLRLLHIWCDCCTLHFLFLLNVYLCCGVFSVVWQCSR